MQTMKCVVDGEEVERLVDHLEHSLDGSGLGLGGQPRQIPVLREGEELFWVFADDRPHIMKTS